MKKTFLFFNIALFLVGLVACRGQRNIVEQNVPLSTLQKENADSVNDKYVEITSHIGIVKEEFVEDENPVFQVVEYMPEYPGGTDALFEYLRKNQRCPELALEKGLNGMVFVQFIVERDSSLSNVELYRSVAYSLMEYDPEVVKPIIPLIDEEAVRLVNNMPKWKPGEQRGEKVRVKITLPISFPPRSPFGKM